MEQMLLMRELIISFYKRNETIVLFIVKFIVGVFVFSMINQIGFVRPELADITKKSTSLPMTLLLSILFTVLPITFSYTIIILSIAAQLSAVIEVCIFVTGFLFCALFFYVRISAKESILILATFLAFHFNLPYMIPLIAGLYFSLTSIIPVSLGVFIYSLTPAIKALMTTTKTADLNIMEMPSTFSELYVTLVHNVTADQQWIFTAFIFSMTIIIVYVVSRLSIDYSKEIAIILGAVLNIVSYIIALIVAKLDIDILIMILLTIFCALLVQVIKFFDIVLDYQRAERVQFQDDENFYFVKVIPKVILAKRKRVVRRIRPEYESDYDDSDFEE